MPRFVLAGLFLYPVLWLFQNIQLPGFSAQSSWRGGYPAPAFPTFLRARHRFFPLFSRHDRHLLRLPVFPPDRKENRPLLAAVDGRDGIHDAHHDLSIRKDTVLVDSF